MNAPSADLTTTLAGLRLANPVLTAAGCAGAGRELAAYFPPAELGGFVSRSVTLDPPRPGPRRSLAETPSGVLTGGPAGQGVDGFLATDLPWLAQHKVRAIVSITAGSVGQYAELSRRLAPAPGIAGVEVNLSGPSGLHQQLGADPYQAGRLVAVVRREAPRGVPVLVKLAPETSSVVDLARAVVDAGADAVVLVNAAQGLSLDPRTLEPVLGHPGVGDEESAPGAAIGALSGPALRPIALRCVWQVHAALPQLPVVGVGGIGSGRDALHFLAAGATAVQVGTATLRDPTAPLRVRDELGLALAAHGFSRVGDAVGYAHRTGRTT